MNAVDVKRCVNEIENVARCGDSERAHSMEDDLHRAVLRAIAKDCTDIQARQFARAALKTINIDFARWCG